MNGKKLKILLFLFGLNFLSLYFYFSVHPDHHHPPPVLLSPPGYSRPRLPLAAKPWPILPSYLPWSHGQNTTSFRSCEAYFGNGYTQRVDPLKPTSDPGRKVSPSGGAGGWFRCFYSATLGSSICEGGRIRMVLGRISMSDGGEKLESVIGRGEDEELPHFKDGAFQIEVGDRSRSGEKLVDEEFLDRYLPEGAVHRHTMRGLIDSIRLVDATEFTCSEWIEEPTLLVTRFEYANVFHTFTDWYSAYVASRVTGLPSRPRLVFVDGHCQTRLEETWTALFSSLAYAKNLSGPVCFRHVILAPLGYETSLFKGLSENINCQGASAHDLWQKPDDRKTARLSEFGEMLRAAFGLPLDRHHIHRSGSDHNILFVRREDYLAHPRHGGKVRAIQDSSVIIGAHGAGLTHIISATSGTVILEIISSEYRRPHFALIAQWKGLEYHAINLDGSYAEPRLVINELSSILTSLGC
ncbi:beta-1,2-xylosyltransferase isoform X2 [Henckelia pumila]|uniref:beta-1,2-xylosyltransferase isoform X2 n=1 Tax=Henckelia pumila TaxID=405737 RepID=UPI003C6DFB99